MSEKLKIYDLIDEIGEIVDTSVGLPMTGSVVVKSADIMALLEELVACLPEELKQARWIQNERDRILNEAREQYNVVVGEAKQEAMRLVERDNILREAKIRKEEIDKVTLNNVKRLKLSTYDYIDAAMHKFQKQMEEMNKMYTDMFTELDDTFTKVEEMVKSNREEIKELAYRVKNDTIEG